MTTHQNASDGVDEGEATPHSRRTLRQPQLLGVAAEALLFRRNRWRMWAATLKQMFRESFLRILLVAGLTTVFWCIMYFLFREGFSLLRTAVGHPPTLARTVHAVYNIFFLSLLVMLSVSSGILYYAAVYKAPDMPFLLTIPARASRLAFDKSFESTLLACWGFVLLGSPLLMAYGMVNESPISYFILSLPLLVSFAVIPAGIGALSCLALVTLAPKFRRAVMVVIGLLCLGMLVFLLWTIFGATPHQTMSAMWLQSTLARLRVAEQRILPSWWLSTGLLEAAHGGPNGTLQAIGFQCVLLSNALLLPRIVGYVGGRCLRTSFGQLSDIPRLNLPLNLSWLDRLLFWLMKPLPRGTQLLLVKDLRLFRRDPLQWSQFLLFFGLLSFYFIYVRRFDYGQQLTGWMTAIGFMNLGVVGLILSTFTTRFVFPLISIEGRRFWILGTAPIPRRSILWSKFIFAAIVTGVPCCILVFLSDIALQLLARTPSMVAVHQLLCLLMATGLSAISVGLGARLPNLREPSPAKIAAGFGGTLTLILSAAFVLAIVIPPAVPGYLMFADHDLGWAARFASFNTRTWFFIALCWSTLFTAIAILMPLRVGFEAFERLEAQ